MRNSQLLQSLIPGLIHDFYEFQYKNTDYWRYRPSARERAKRKIEENILYIVSKIGFVRKNRSTREVAKRLVHTLHNIDKLECLYHLLGDEYSRQILVECLRFRILGSRYVKLPLNNQEFWKTRALVDSKFLMERDTITVSGWDLNRYKLDKSHGAIELHCISLNILNTFLLEQYAYKKGSKPIQVEKADVVIDAGACWGDTSLYFAQKAGVDGKVYCFEFVPENLDVLYRNLSVNQILTNRIKIVPSPVWDRSGEVLAFEFNGPGTSLRAQNNGSATTVVTVSIDDFVERERIGRVDFIKMDIEGAEITALQGAEKTIRSFRPKLAISLYHKDDDFVEIPHYLEKLGLQYNFFLDHFTIYREETVLFASPY
jgi:FkbM family methyltransferase